MEEEDLFLRTLTAEEVKNIGKARPHRNGVCHIARAGTTYPDETTDYAFDQFPDRIGELGYDLSGGGVDIKRLSADKVIICAPSVRHLPELVEVYQDAIMEKYKDIEREIRTGEREE